MICKDESLMTDIVRVLVRNGHLKSGTKTLRSRVESTTSLNDIEMGSIGNEVNDRESTDFPNRICRGSANCLCCNKKGITRRLCRGISNCLCCCKANGEQTGSENSDPKTRNSSEGVNYKLIDNFLQWVYKPMIDDSGKPNQESSSNMNNEQDTNEWFFTTLMINKPEIAKKCLDCWIMKKTDGETVLLDFSMIHKPFPSDTEDMSGSGSNTQKKQKYIKMEEDHPLIKVLTRKKEDTDQQQQYQEFMEHPLIRCYVRREWSRIKRSVILFLLLTYLPFLVVYSACILLSNPRSSNLSLWNEEMPCLPHEGENTIVSLSICVIILAAFLIIIEIFEIVKNRRSYFPRGYENFFQLTAYFSSIVFSAMNFHSTCNRVVQDAQWFIGVLSIFVTWFNLLGYVKRIERLGVYVMMFEKVVLKFIRVVCVFPGIFIGGFGIVFYSLLYENKSFATISLAFPSTAAMIAGEVEYSSKLIEERPHFLILICFFIILFIVLVPILIMNLLVAAIVDGFQDIQKSSVAEEIELQTRLIIRFQYIVWKYKCLKCLRKFSDPVEEIRLDKKSVIYRFPVDAIHSILKEKQKDVDGVQLKNQLNHISIQNGKVLSCLENIQRNCNGSNKNADCTPETGTSNTRMRTRKQPSPVEEIDTQIAKLERKFESLSKDVKDIKDMLKKVIDREDKLTIQFEQTICQLLEK